MPNEMSFNMEVPSAPPSVKKKIVKPAKSKLADRGKQAESEAAKFGAKWSANRVDREFNRLIDTRAAGRIVKAAKADFEWFAGPTRTRGSRHGLIEVKETRHEYRLDHSKVPQLPQLAHRARCGGDCYVLVLHSTKKYWRAVPALYLSENKTGGSWDLSHWSIYSTFADALADVLPEVFGQDS